MCSTFSQTPSSSDQFMECHHRLKGWLGAHCQPVRDCKENLFASVVARFVFVFVFCSKRTFLQVWWHVAAEVGNISSCPTATKLDSLYSILKPFHTALFQKDHCDVCHFVFYCKIIVRFLCETVLYLNLDLNLNGLHWIKLGVGTVWIKWDCY